MAVRSCGSSGTPFVEPTAFWLGDGGIASPRRGGRPAPLLRVAPGMGGRRRGAGEDMFDSIRSAPSGRRSVGSLVMMETGCGDYLTAMECCQSSESEY